MEMSSVENQDTGSDILSRDFKLVSLKVFVLLHYE